MAKKSKTTPKSKTVVVDGQEVSLEESLDRARIALETSQAQMKSLHRNWRSQLQRMSILSLFLVLKQSSIPAYDCLDQIQIHNDQNDDKIENYEMVQLILGDSLMEVLCVVCCLCLVWLLQQRGDDFSSLPFKLALLSVPLIVASYYMDPMVGCLDSSKEKPRSFPVTLILLVVCFGSLYTMHYQQQQQTENLQKIDKLREDLLGSSGESKKES